MKSLRGVWLGDSHDTVYLHDEFNLTHLPQFTTLKIAFLSVIFFNSCDINFLGF